MPHHDWSDDTFDWKGLYEAEQHVRSIIKYARVGCHSKEKYGTLRWSFYLFNGHFHDLTHPDYVYSQYPKWLWHFDIMYEPLKFLRPIIRFFQVKVIKLAFSSACQKYPHLVKEIVFDVQEELLPPDLAKIRDSMWIKI